MLNSDDYDEIEGSDELEPHACNKVQKTEVEV